MILKLLKFVPPVAWAGAAVAVGAGIIGFAYYMENRGVVKTLMRIEKRDAERLQHIRDKNFKIDRDTIDEDATLAQRLREIDDKWLSERQQSPQSAQ